MKERAMIFYDAQGAAYQPVKHFNQATGRSAYRARPRGASNRTEDFLELDTIEELARAMLVDGLPARVKAIGSNGPVSVLRFGADTLVRYELDPDMAQRLGVPAQSDGVAPAISPSLAHLRDRFLAVFPDFLQAGGFAASSGSYHDSYRQRVDALLAATHQHPTDGWAVLRDLLTASQGGRGSLPPFFEGDVNWRVPRARDVDPAGFDAALDTLVTRQDDPVAALTKFNEAFWPALQTIGQATTFRDTRIVPSAVLAAVAPNRAILVRYLPYSRAERLLNGRTLLRNKPITADEYRAVLSLAEQIRTAMIDWGWAPRDLWDVHGFILAAAKNDQEIELDDNAVLGRFNGAALFRAMRATWTADQNGAFCVMARAVNAAGLDWYHTNMPRNPVRFGRKPDRDRRAKATLGYLEGQTASRIWLSDKPGRPQVGQHAFPLDRASADRFVEALVSHAPAIEGWEALAQERPGRWPDEAGFDEEDANDAEQAKTEAIMISNPTNLILYGPPGTGKTFTTAQRAVALADGDAADEPAAVRSRYDELVAAGQVRFVTFHQSYAYEDFIEGLRPTTGEMGEEGGAGTGFQLEPVPGVFREMASVAEQAMKSAGSGAPFDLRGRQIFKMSLGRAGSEDAIFDAAIEGDYVVLGWGGEIDWTPFDHYEAIRARWNEDHPDTNGNDSNILQTTRFRADMRIGDLVVISYGNTRFRAIGEVVGDYEFAPGDVRDYNHRRRVRWLYVPPEPLPITFYDKPFTMRSCYLLREDSLNREALALLLPGSGEGQASAPRQFVLIIDEINRGNISKVFGELITLIEREKRLGMKEAMRLRLPYSKQDFGVPANLHIIGTMNTADRSIALLDTALRRRFTFEELMPRADLLDTVDGIDLATLLVTLNDRIEYLFDREHQIGHAYFLPCRSRADIDEVMRHKVIPLLAEYFYEDWTKVAAVLGDVFEDDGRTREGGFLARHALRSPFGAAEGEDVWRYRWTVRDPADFSYTRLTNRA